MKIRASKPLSLESLSGRDVPATFGIPWSDPGVITISFMPDDASVAGIPNTLSSTLDALMPTDIWQSTLRGAAQTWADAANLNIAFTVDQGGAAGIDGETQADPRFGDIRFAALPMEGDALGEALPPDPLLTGTFAGDIYFNSSIGFTPTTLRSVALHEIGHALGLEPSTDPESVMFNTYGDHTELAPSDVLAIRKLYGSKLPDATDRGSGNDTRGRSTRLRFAPDFDGGTPLIAYGSLTTPKDVDFFKVRNYASNTGPITVRLQTEGVSLFRPQLTVFDNRGQILAQLDGVGDTGDTLTYTIPTTLRGRTYFFRVDTAPNSQIQTGRFGLAVTFDNLLEPSDTTIDEVLRGPYDRLSLDDMHDLFEHPERTFFNDSDHDDSVRTSRNARSENGEFGQSRIRIIGSTAEMGDDDFFRIRAPKNDGQPMSLTVAARAIGQLGATPRIEVYDRHENLIPSTILVNGAGRFTVQVDDIEPSRRYFLRVVGQDSGNFSLDATFRNEGIGLQAFASGTVTAAAPDEYSLYAARTQLFGFALSANGPAGSSVQFTITDLDGNTVFALTAAAGDTVTGLSTFLAPGEYDVKIVAVGTTQPVSYAIVGAMVTDPLGPQANDSTLKPIYQDPTDPNRYLYPGGTLTFDPYLWLPKFI